MLREDPAPPQIPDYQLLRKIGQGSYGVVWLAQGITGVYRAVKIVWRVSFEDPQPYEREFRGIKEFAAVSLIEPRQLALLHVGRNDEAGFFYYVMELADDAVSGREIDPESYVPHTLREVRARRGRLPAEETLTLGVDLAGALAGLHAHELVHRDIKPSNIIFVGGVPKLADIGLVTSAATTALTMSRVGNAGYMPPDLPGTPSADVYGLGKVLYELATGRERDDYPRLPANLDTLPDRKALLELNEIFVRACHANPEKGYSDATAMRDDLLLLQAGKSVRRLRAAERHLGRALRMAAVLGVVSALAGGGAWLEHQRARKAETERDALARHQVYSGKLASAQRAIGNGDFGRARRLLSELKPKSGETDLRGFEWHVLWRDAQGDPHQELRSEGPAIDRLALSPDEALVAVHDISGAIAVYDSFHRRQLLRIDGARQFSGFSPDGRWLIGSNRELALTRWAVKNGQPDSSATGPTWRPLAGIAPDDVIAMSKGPPIRLHRWSFAAAVEKCSVSIPPMPAGNVSWAPFRMGANADGSIVVLALVQGAGSSARFLLVQARFEPSPAVQLQEIGATRPSSVGVDRHGAWAIGDATGELWRCDNNTWTKTNEQFPPGTRKYLEFVSANQHEAVTSRMREIVRLNPSGSTGVARGHGGLISDFVASAKQRTVFSAAEDGSLFCWDLDKQALPKTRRMWDANGGATRAVFTADASKLWIPEDGRSCSLLDLGTFEIVARAEGMLYPIALTTSGLIGVASDFGLIRVNAETGMILERLMPSNSPVRIAAATTDARQVAIIDHAGMLHAASGPAWRPVRDGMDRYFAIVLDPEGRRLVTTSTNRDLLCLSWPDGRPLWQQTLPAVAPSNIFLFDGRNIAVALETGMLEIRDAASGRLLRSIDSGSAAPQALAAAPDGSRVFVAGIEGTVHCFDPATWEEIHTLSVGAGERLHIARCSPDGRTLALLTKSGTLHLLRTERDPQ